MSWMERIRTQLISPRNQILREIQILDCLRSSSILVVRKEGKDPTAITETVTTMIAGERGTTRKKTMKSQRSSTTRRRMVSRKMLVTGNVKYVSQNFTLRKIVLTLRRTDVT